MAKPVRLRALVRTVASGVIGAGHVARTAAVATELSGLGVEVAWMCDAVTAPYLLRAGVSESAIRCVPGAATEGRFGEMEVAAPRQAHDARIAAGLLGSHDGAGFAIVDSYLLGAEWHRTLRAAGMRIAAFDDLADRQLDADLVVNAAAGRDEYAALAPRATVLRGLAHAVVARAESATPAAGGSLLVSFGASDPNDLTSHVLGSLDSLVAADGRFPVFVQLGMGAVHRDKVERLVSTLRWARLLESSERLGDPSLGIAVAIGGAGVSLYERMHAGMPTVVLPLAQNQRRIAVAAESAGAAVIARSPEHAASIALQLRGDAVRLGRMSEAGSSAVDGLGARRIASSLVRCFGSPSSAPIPPIP